MRIVMFYHSLRSDWNHGNAHFLRGVVAELRFRGHDVTLFEPRDAWSVQNLLSDQGQAAIDDYEAAYPTLAGVSQIYDLATTDLNAILDEAELVIVHEWNDHELVRRIGEHRRTRGGYPLLFHDTHHRAITDEGSMSSYDLSGYDGVLAFGAVLRDLYLSRRWTKRAWTWHEAADTRVFRPIDSKEKDGDLVWVGNWGDDERTAELHEFLLEPVRALGLRARVHGVRYPEHGKAALAERGIEYAGWLANFRAPEVFSRFRVTVHVMRRPYTLALPGIPTIRVFEALACGIPLVCSPWDDVEHLFQAGKDYLVAHDGAEMKRQLHMLLKDREEARHLAAHGHRTILSKHTCAHRVDELLNIAAEFIAEQSFQRRGSAQTQADGFRGTTIGST